MGSISQYAGRQKIRKHLERCLRPLRDGEPLPPVRTLMAETGASQAKLEAVLDEMRVEGLIERRQRKGIFKADNSEREIENRCVDLVTCESPPAKDYHAKSVVYTAALIEAFADEASDRQYSIRSHKFSHDTPIGAYEALAQQRDIKACILLWVHSPEIPVAFEHANVDWISLAPRMGPHGTRCIVHSPDLVDLQLNHLWSLGHSRIGYIYSGPMATYNYTVSQRREGYYRLMAEKGCKVEPHWVAPADYSQEAILGAVGQLFSREPYPTAIISQDLHLPVIYRFVQDRGLVVGKDISLVGTDDVTVASILYPKATSVRNCPRLAARMAFDSLDKVMRGETIDDIQYIRCELIERESSGPAPE